MRKTKAPLIDRIILANALVTLSEQSLQGKLRGPEFGICANINSIIYKMGISSTRLNTMLSYAEDWIREAGREWSEYSGHDSFPIPAPDKLTLYYPWSTRRITDPVHRAYEAYGYYMRDKNQWGDHDYARNRRRFLAYLLERIATEL